jgi:uncharacterized protein
MELLEDAVLLKIYLGEADKVDGRPTYKLLVEELRKAGLWGATVTRGIHGFGRESVMHSATPLRLSQDLPIVIEAVDKKEKIEAVLPRISHLVKGGLVLTAPVTAHVLMGP